MLPQETEAELDLRAYVQVLRRRKTIVFLVLLVIVGGSLAASYRQDPQYAATAKLLLEPPSTGTVFESQSQSDFISVVTDIEVMTAEPVQNLVRERIGQAPVVAVGLVGTTRVAAIKATSTDPDRAAVVANAYANAYIDFRRSQAIENLSAASEQMQTKVTDLQGQLEKLNATLAAAPVCTDPRTTPQECAQRTAAEQSVTSRRSTLNSQIALFQQRLDQLQVDTALSTGGARLVTPASPPKKPFAPKPLRNGIIAGVLGLLLGVGLAFLIEFLDDSIKGKEDFDQTARGLPVLALIPIQADWKEKQQSRLISASDPTSAAAEAYRILRTSIQFFGLDRQVRVIQVTSANAQEGKSTTLANLAVAFAASGLRTVAVDCDLRRPRLHDFFGLRNDTGFTSVLLGNIVLSKALQPVPKLDRLLVLTSGPLPPNPSELLSSSRTADLLRSLGDQADIVLIDSPPTLPVTDALVLSQRVDSTVLVTTARVTTQKAVSRAIEMLRQVHAPLVGAVLNGMEQEGGYSNYSYRYYRADPASPNGHANGNGQSTLSRRERRRAKKRFAT